MPLLLRWKLACRAKPIAMKNLPIKGAICYKSWRTATGQYAEWIAEETGFPVFDLSKTKPDLAEYDLLVLGSAVYVGRFHLVNWLQKHWPEIRNKHLVLFSVSGTAPDHPDIRSYFENNLSPEMRELIEYFPLQGKLKLEEAGFWLRLFLKLAARMEKDPDAKKRMKEGFDFMKRENVLPVVEAVKELAMTHAPLDL